MSAEYDIHLEKATRLPEAEEVARTEAARAEDAREDEVPWPRRKCAESARRALEVAVVERIDEHASGRQVCKRLLRLAPVGSLVSTWQSIRRDGEEFGGAGDGREASRGRVPGAGIPDADVGGMESAPRAGRCRDADADKRKELRHLSESTSGRGSGVQCAPGFGNDLSRGSVRSPFAVREWVCAVGRNDPRVEAGDDVAGSVGSA